MPSACEPPPSEESLSPERPLIQEFGNAFAEVEPIEDLLRSVFDCARRTWLTIALLIWSSVAATAQALPSPWSSTDVGAPAIEGTAEIIFRIQGAGTDVWGTADQFRFHQPIACGSSARRCSVRAPSTRRG